MSARESGRAALLFRASKRETKSGFRLFDNGRLAERGRETEFRPAQVARAEVDGSGPGFGKLRALGGCLLDHVPVGRRVFIHVNNTNPALLADSPERAELERAGWEVAQDGMELTL